MNKHIIAFTIILLIGSTAFLQAETVLTVEEAVKVAMENNLSLERTMVNTAGKKRAADRSWNGFIPSVTAGGILSHATSVTGELLPAQDKWIPGFNVSASMGLNPALVTNISASKRDYESGLITYEAAKQELELSVRKVFYQIQLIQANMDLIAQQIATAQSRYDQAAALARVGQASALDELSARVDLENLKPSLKSIEAQYFNALDSFKQVLGLPAEDDITLKGTLADIHGTVDISNVSSQKGESYSISSLRKSLEVIEAQKKSAVSSAYVPSLSLSWTSMPLYTNDIWNDANGSFSLGLTFKLDNYLPWSSAREQIDTLNDTITNYKSQITEAMMNSDNKIRQYQRTIEQSLENIKVLELNVSLAEQTYKMYDESYKKGTADLQSLRSANDSLLRAQNSVLEEIYNLMSATLDLEKELNVPFGTLWRS